MFVTFELLCGKEIVNDFFLELMSSLLQMLIAVPHPGVCDAECSRYVHMLIAHVMLQ